MQKMQYFTRCEREVLNEMKGKFCRTVHSIYMLVCNREREITCTESSHLTVIIEERGAAL